MKERTNEEQLDLLADMLEPLIEIAQDPDVSGDNRTPAMRVKAAIRSHKKAVIQLLALADEQDPADYKVPNPLEMFVLLTRFIQRPEINMLFQSQLQSDDSGSSGAAMATTGDGAE